MAQDVKKLHPSKCAIITDSNVAKSHYGRLESALLSEGIRSEAFPFPAGEKSKNERIYYDLSTRILARKFDRDTLIIGLGGGVTTDLAGFVAGTLLRGVDLFLYPTTLLAQVDAAIGGKNGIDTEFGKNQLGTYKLPGKVYNDAEVLQDLNNANYRSGLAEIVKTAVIRDPELFIWLEARMDQLVNRCPDELLYVIQKCCAIKSRIVQQDPEDKGCRNWLNYGHTIGHALEKASKYRMHHGPAISIGMNVEGRASFELGFFPFEHWLQQEKLLERTGLPVLLPLRFSNRAIISATYGDKKSANGQPRYSPPIAIGRMYERDGKYAIPVDDSVLKKAFYECRP